MPEIASAQQALLDKMADIRLPIEKRARAGRKLAALGDPRPGVGLREDGIADMIWCDVPGTEQGRPPVVIGGATPTVGTSSPMQIVEVSDFAIAKYLVTYSQFQAFTNDNGFVDDQWWTGVRREPRRVPRQKFKFANHPCENVTWWAAIAYCKWLSAKLGYEVRLPTSEEWEKTARGEDGRVYPWGNDHIRDYANIWEVTREPEPEQYAEFDGVGQTSAVGLYPPDSASPYGVMDMAGNVWEWTATRIEIGKIPGQPPYYTDARILKGGGWNSYQYPGRHEYTPSATRRMEFPYAASAEYGFRLAAAFGTR